MGINKIVQEIIKTKGDKRARIPRPTGESPSFLTLASQWEQLVHLPESELAVQDIAVVNLACAKGLHGAEGLDVAHFTGLLDECAQLVRYETDRCAAQFKRNPAAFENSWAYFRILVLATVLQEDRGVHYDPNLVDRDDFFNSAANLFIHGVLDGMGGTCSSLPPVYVAVGRRLGYPLKLAQTNSHLFARWDDAATGERFNIECTSHGLNCYSDDYYRNWPLPTTPAEVEHNGWLVSLTPREELGLFLANRGHSYLANAQFRQACEAYAWARVLAPRQAGYGHCLVAALAQWSERLEQAIPSGFFRVTVRMSSRRSTSLPRELEEAILDREVIEDLLENPVHYRD